MKTRVLYGLLTFFFFSGSIYILLYQYSVEMELWKVEIDELKKLCETETENLQKSLLNGSTWEETADQRMKVTELSTVLFKRLNPTHFSNPAESSLRESSETG